MHSVSFEFLQHTQEHLLNPARARGPPTPLGAIQSRITPVSTGAAKLSVSVPNDLAKTVRKRLGARGLSSFATRAMRHELEREQLGDFLAELDAELGVLPEKILANARSTWHKR